jgi:hypothetical protein
MKVGCCLEPLYHFIRSALWLYPIKRTAGKDFLSIPADKNALKDFVNRLNLSKNVFVEIKSSI